MVHLYLEFANFKSPQDLLDNREHLSVRDHQRVVASYIEIALIEFSKAASVHLRLITSINFSHVEALDLLNTFRGNISCKGNGQVVS